MSPGHTTATSRWLANTNFSNLKTVHHGCFINPMSLMDQRETHHIKPTKKCKSTKVILGMKSFSK